MLERARATSLALLGATAAVGLGIVALALNQSWPLLEGSAIPAAPKQEIGSASVVARPQVAGPRVVNDAHRHGGGRPVNARSGAPAHTDASVEAPSGGEGAAGLVVSEEAPASAPAGAPPKPGKAAGGHSQPAPIPTAQPPTAAPPSSPPAKAPAAPPEAAPPAPTQPEAIVSEAPPEESSVPSWSQGKGHAYGRDEEEHGHGWGDGEH